MFEHVLSHIPKSPAPHLTARVQNESILPLPKIPIRIHHIEEPGSLPSNLLRNKPNSLRDGLIAHRGDTLANSRHTAQDGDQDLISRLLFILALPILCELGGIDGCVHANVQQGDGTLDDGQHLFGLASLVHLASDGKDEDIDCVGCQNLDHS